MTCLPAAVCRRTRSGPGTWPQWQLSVKRQQHQARLLAAEIAEVQPPWQLCDARSIAPCHEQPTRGGSQLERQRGPGAVSCTPSCAANERECTGMVLHKPVALANLSASASRGTSSGLCGYGVPRLTYFCVDSATALPPLRLCLPAS